MNTNLSMKRIPKNPSQDRINNFLAVTNAFAEQQRQLGEPTEFLRKDKAAERYEELMIMAIAA